LFALTALLGACARPGPTEAEKQAAARKAAESALGELTAIVAAVAAGKAETGVELRASASGPFVPVKVGAPLPAGGTLRTAAAVQVRLTLRDGSILHLNERSQLALLAGRQLSLSAGELLAEVVPAGGKPLEIATGAGSIRVTGTKLNVKVDPAEGTVVDVTRGTVEVSSSQGGDARIQVGAGERATVKTGESPRLSPSRDLAETTRWAREIGIVPGQAGSILPGIGSLEARAPGGGGRGQPLRLARQTVRVTVQDNVARTEVEQEYYNPTGQTLEGTYRFPIPASASISRLALYVGNRLEEGEIVERQRARQIFRQIVEDTVRPRDPALLEWVGGRTFQMKIFPIPPRASRRVILGYTQPLAASYGRYRYEYPLASDPGKATVVGRFAIELKAKSSLGPVEVTTPLYPTTKEANKDESTQLRFEASDFRPAASFVASISGKREPGELTFALFEPEKDRRAGACLSSSTVAGAEAATAAIMMRDRRALPRPRPPSCGDQGGFFMATLRPELPRGERAKPQDLLFLLDSSYSTGKRGWVLSTTALEAFLTEMDVRGRFNVLVCNTRCRAFAATPRNPTAEARKEALHFVRMITPSGSTHLANAFAEAAARIAANKGEAPAQIVYLGDGRPSVGELREAELARFVVRKLSAVGASLSAIQVGEDAGELFLSETTRRLGGAVHRIDAGDDVAGRVFEIVAAQYRPTLADLELSFEGIDVHHVYPSRLESLSAGSEAVIVGRYDKGGQGAIRLRGKLAGKPFERRFPIALAAEDAEKRANTFLPRLWAKHHLDALSAEGHAQNRAEIVRVSKAYTVLSKATAFLVLENEKMYREFGVKRRRDKSDWKGDALASRSGRDTPEATATPTADADKSASKGASEQAPTGKPVTTAVPALGAGGSAMPAAEPSARPRRAAAGKSAPLEKDEAPRGESRKATDDADDLTDAAPKADPLPPPAKKAKAGPRREAESKSAAPRMSRGMIGRGYHRRPVPVLQTTIAPLLGSSGPSPAARRQQESLRAGVESNPLKRALHLAYHRALLKNGDYPEALRHAQKWAELDGAHADALAALGTAQAAQGALPAAIESLASSIDVEPWNPRRHEQLAAIYRHKGDPALACAHLQSLAALAPRDVARALAAASCLAALPGDGREAAIDLLTVLAGEKLGPAELGKVARALAAARSSALAYPPAFAAGRIGGPLVARATWTAPVDLDLAIVTPRGQRLSALHTLRSGGVLVDSRDGASAEILQLAGLPNGEYRLEIGRAQADASAAGITGTVLIQAGGKRQTIAFSLGAESPRAIARIKVERLYRLY
jgi:tetratricopeptide (TPR) repeat protein